MALLPLTSRIPSAFSENPKPFSLSSIFSTSTAHPSIAFFSVSYNSSRLLHFPSLRSRSSGSGGASGPASGGKDGSENPSGTPSKITDEWGEEYEPETTPTKLPDSDPPKYEDEWEEGGGDVEDMGQGNGTPAATIKDQTVGVDDRLVGLKQALVDTVYGTDFGFRAGPEVRAEVSELVNQLEAANPTPAPVEEPRLLNGTWVLLYTASSELLPLLAAGTTPLLKVDKISQTIDTGSSTIVNSTTLSSPFNYLSFSASASFEVRSPTRIQVTFKEGTIQPPEIKSRLDLPENIDIFGQKLSLSPVQQTLSPLQDLVVSISRAISGQPPLKIPIPGERTSSWLITTYLDDDLRISRGDGGLFILARDGSPLLNQ
ncbi:plastoglobulin-1, chloroplastic-like [Prosopis cineraria]|uniref:plastoglobulin-1, chloroplastic-like n=1 Tax=Prosopis cineraria TaxID=364024 RepID=UPI00240F0F97|nr:plastoglobulin-1, chloroplastic-like [Prosopis cineraria]